MTVVSPNPFNPSTVIGYELPARDHVKITVFNLLGQPVRTLVGEEMEAGSHMIEWDGHDNLGNRRQRGFTSIE